MDDGMKAWLKNTARHERGKQRAIAAKGRKRFSPTHPYAVAASLVADAHENCADVWQKFLDDLDARGGKPGKVSGAKSDEALSKDDCA